MTRRAKPRLRIPRTLRIAGERWRVVMVPGMKRDRGEVGFMDADKHLIEIDPGQSRVEIERTLVHEVLHVLWPAGICGSRAEERAICEMERPLHRVIALLRKAA